MKNVSLMILILLTSLMVGCSSAKVRNLETDAQLRVVIDPKIPVAHYVQIRSSLVRTGKFEVVDRQEGFDAVVAEQELQHGSDGRRFSDQEKWAWYGQMYGGASIVSATPICYNKFNIWGRWVKYCKQELVLINGNTGRVELAISGENSEESVGQYSVPDWNETVEKLAAEYPKYFKPRVVQKSLQDYMDQSEEGAKRERVRRSVANKRDNQVAAESLDKIRNAMKLQAEQQAKEDSQEDGE